MDIMEALLWLCLNVYHEARSDDRMSQLAVAHVTMNRAKKRGLTIRETVLQPKQFSWVDRVEIMPKEYKAMMKIADVVLTAVKGNDFTQGATHYHRVDIYPDWAQKMEYLTTFGSHKYYKEYEVQTILASTNKIYK